MNTSLTGLDFTPLEGSPFGVEVEGFDCVKVTSGQADVIRRVLHENQLLVFRDQGHLVPQEEVEFYRKIDTGATTVWRDQTQNPWEVYKVEQGNHAGTYQVPDEPGVLVLGKGDIDHFGLRVKLGGARAAYGEDNGSQVLGGGSLQWHIDGAFYDHEPCMYTQMRCIEAPKSSAHWIDYDDGSGAKLYCYSGSTAFVSGRRAFRLLSADQQARSLHMKVHYRVHPFKATFRLGNSKNGLRIVDPEAEKKFLDGQDDPGLPVQDRAAKVHPLVWTCPVTEKKALMPHPRCMNHLEEDDGHISIHLGVVESRFLIEEFMRPGINPEHVYVHAWHPGDLIIWDNRSIWHSATGGLAPNDRRIQHLTAFNGAVSPQ
ncbi:MAG: TauD/TfdA family dioxygenase [Arenicellales bacterium]|nr:TauD/TfdA family dioxygenase [Arenicellales bacterium]